MPYDPPANDAVNFSEEGSYSPPQNDAVNFPESLGSQSVTLNAPVTNLSSETPTASVDATNSLEAPASELSTQSPTPTVASGVIVDVPSTSLSILSEPSTLQATNQVNAPITNLGVSTLQPTVNAIETLSAAVTVLDVLSPSSNVNPGQVTVDAAKITLQSSTPTTSLDATATLGASITTLLADIPNPEMRVVEVLSAPTTTITAQSPQIGVAGGPVTVTAATTTLTTKNEKHALNAFNTLSASATILSLSTLDASLPFLLNAPTTTLNTETKPAAATGGATSFEPPTTKLITSSPEAGLDPGQRTINAVENKLTLNDLGGSMAIVEALFPEPTTIDLSTQQATTSPGEATANAPATEAELITTEGSMKSDGVWDVNAPTTNLRLTSPFHEVDAETFKWRIGKIEIPDPDSVKITPEGVSLIAIADFYKTRQLREFEDTASDMQLIYDDEGRFRVVDTAGEDLNNAYKVTPRLEARVPHRTGVHYLESYNDSSQDQRNDYYQVSLSLSYDESRSAPPSQSHTESRDTGEWLFELANGNSISTHRVSSENREQVSKGVIQRDVTLLLTDAQMELLDKTWSYAKAITINTIPDGFNQIVDQSDQSRMTVDVTSPNDKVVTGENRVLPTGTWYVKDWTGERRSERIYKMDVQFLRERRAVAPL
jgi:hypothetical protein